MSMLRSTCADIEPVDLAMARQAQEALDAKTKPRGSLGVLERLACQLAAIYRCPAPALPGKAVVILAADHGVTEEGVSAYPAEVTRQMLDNFAHGGAAINVLARQAGARVVVVDMGTKRLHDVNRHVESHPGSLRDREDLQSWTTILTGLPAGKIHDASLGPGTLNFTRGPAMTLPQALQAIDIGIRIATELCKAGLGLIAVGEMGIGNTTSSSALTAVFTGATPAQVTGHGTGIDEATRQHKVRVIEKALSLHRPLAHEPVQALAQMGGFELAGLVGVMLGAAASRVPVVLDGFITGAAALVAVRCCPPVRDYLIASHQSVEPGHRILLDFLQLRPLHHLELRLGEGTGAVLAMYLVEAALRLVREMATFESARVTDAGA